MTTPKVRYEADLANADFLADAAQQRAMEALETLYHDLVEQPTSPTGLRGWWQNWRGRGAQSLPGLYLWGGVGRGKTYLMDTFYECLPAKVAKRRVHFHRFMQSAHERLRALREQPDPLQTLAKEWADEVQVLCFDEFFVSDIADAMILSGLLHGLIEAGVTLVVTSNVPPDQLYRDGLQRERFLPAIALLEQHTQSINVDGDVDYRLMVLSQAPIYYAATDPGSDAAMAEAFERLCPDREPRARSITIQHRDINARAVGDGVLWCQFADLCEGPRSQDDYIDIARQFHTVFISDIPIFDRDREDAARRFIALIDEFYDRGVNVIVSADADIDWLYRGFRLSFEFRRTLSRLKHMQTHAYLALPHQP